MNYYQLLKKVYLDGAVVEARGLKTKELCGVQLEVDKYNFFSTPVHRPFEQVMEYLLAEWCWYLSGERHVRNILPYSKFWEKIQNHDKTANSNYGDLVFYRKNLHGYTSFEWAKDALLEDRNTRKAIVLYADREFFWPGINDQLCNQYQHFLIRDNKLICFVGLRSSDAILGLQYNIPWWSLVQQQLRFALLPKYPNLQLGPITAFISSSHIYENKFKLVSDILASPQERFFIRILKTIPTGQDFSWYRENLSTYYKVEKA